MRSLQPISAMFNISVTNSKAEVSQDSELTMVM
jgi:hypothetical protein